MQQFSATMDFSFRTIFRIGRRMRNFQEFRANQSAKHLHPSVMKNDQYYIDMNLNHPNVIRVIPLTVGNSIHQLYI